MANAVRAGKTKKINIKEHDAKRMDGTNCIETNENVIRHFNTHVVKTYMNDFLEECLCQHSNSISWHKEPNHSKQ
jgi:hypothetical protein